LVFTLHFFQSAAMETLRLTQKIIAKMLKIACNWSSSVSRPKRAIPELETRTARRKTGWSAAVAKNQSSTQVATQTLAPWAIFFAPLALGF
jgi:hypothetical protein